MLKCIAFMDADGPLVALVPGDREVLPRAGWRAFEDGDFAAHPALVKGYIGPMGLQERGVRVLADVATNFNQYWTTGANQLDHHVTNAVVDRDFTVDGWVPLTAYRAGDPCPECGAGVELVQSVEIAHAFQLGDRYSMLPGATYRDAAGDEHAFWMGCYGIGLSRLLAVIAEAHHDDAGLVWPAGIAPFDVHLVALKGAEVEAETLYEGLVAAGRTVLFDDRDASPGVKFADADLLGMPVQVVVGPRGLANGVVERKARGTGNRDELSIKEAVAAL
jgi:prolyl-tRNA synthetase